MATVMKRQPAKKFWIADILNAEAKIGEHGGKYFEIREMQASRVNVLAALVSVYINELANYAVAVVDDGTAQVKLKFWNEDVKLANNAAIGDIVLVIGKLNINDFNNEIFIRPEIIKPTSIDWMHLRRAEMMKKFGEPRQLQRDVVQEEAPQEVPSFEEQVIAADEKVKAVSISIRGQVVNVIEADDSASGVSIAQVIEKSGLKESDATAAIEELIREGEAFQPKQGFIKLLS